jgi:hypothetical protein
MQIRLSAGEEAIFPSTVEAAAQRPKIFPVAAKYEQFFPESAAPIHARWGRQASMARRSFVAQSNRENHESA